MTQISVSRLSVTGFITSTEPSRRSSASHILPGNLCQLQGSSTIHTRTFIISPILHSVPSLLRFSNYFRPRAPWASLLHCFSVHWVAFAYSLALSSLTFASVFTCPVLFLISAVLLTNCNRTLSV